MGNQNARWIIVNGWEDFQHPDVLRSSSTPAWIKVYTRLLSDDDYLSLTLAQRGLLHGIWIEYARSNGCLTDVRTRVQLATNRGESAALRTNLEALNEAGFITFSASKPQAASKQAASLDKRREENPLPPTSPASKTRRPRTSQPTHEEVNPYVCGINGCTVRHATEERIAEHRENVHGVTATDNGHDPELTYLASVAPDPDDDLFTT